MATCLVCQPGLEVAEVEILDHLRIVHPDVWGDGPVRWPDGRIVVLDATLEPGDFSAAREACKVFHSPSAQGVCMRCGRRVFRPRA